MFGVDQRELGKTMQLVIRLPGILLCVLMFVVGPAAAQDPPPLPDGWTLVKLLRQTDGGYIATMVRGEPKAPTTVVVTHHRAEAMRDAKKIGDLRGGTTASAMFEAMDSAGRMLTGKSPPLRGAVVFSNGIFQATTKDTLDDQQVRVYGEANSPASPYLKNLRGVDLSIAPLPEVVARTWSDRSGTFQVTAKMLDAADGKVTLLTSSNKTIEVLYNSLSPADQAYALDMFKRVIVPLRPYVRKE